jgi:hypothetical protein
MILSTFDQEGYTPVNIIFISLCFDVLVARRNHLNNYQIW